MAGAKAGKTKKRTPAKPAKQTAQTPKASRAAKPTARARPKPRTTTTATRQKPRANRTATGTRPSARTGPATAASIDKLHQVALTATDLDASVAFYRDILGLKFIARFDPPGLAFFNLGGIRLLLSATASEATLYFVVSDVKAAYRTFQKRGVHFLQPPAMIHRDDAGDFGKKGVEEWMAFFRDPCGNILALVQRK